MNLNHLYSCLVLLVCLVQISCTTPKAQIENDPPTITTVADLDLQIESMYNKSEIPGFSVVVVRDGKVAFHKSLGFANIESKQAYTKTSIQNIASISKTIIAVAIMKAVDLGKVDLDADINTYLPFEVRNPKHPQKKITLRHLASHTSTITDSEVYDKSYFFPDANTLNAKDYPLKFRFYLSTIRKHELIDESIFLENALAKDGAWYSESIFSERAPGDAYEYSNMASTLAAFVVERATGIPYEDFTKEHIFEALGMNNTSWDYETTKDENFVSRYYTKKVEFPNYYLITKADGGLYTNTSDFALFMMEMIRGFKGDGTILSKSAYTTMFTKQSEPNEGTSGGIFWEMGNQPNQGFRHNGSDPGVTTFSSYNSSLNRGQIMFANIGDNENASMQLSEIWNAVGVFDWSE